MTTITPKKVGGKQDGPLIGFEAGACAWPVLVALATLPDASEAERLFASQGLLFRVRRFDLADALDIADPVALQAALILCESSAEAAAEANEQGVATLGALVLGWMRSQRCIAIAKHSRTPLRHWPLW